MILQVQDMLKDAMGLIGAIEIDETPSSSELNLILRAANVMIDRWSSQNLLLRSTTQLAIPLVVNQASYTVGLSGANITAPKPIKVLSGYFRDTGNIDNPIEIVDTATYNNFTDKEVTTGLPMYVNYDPGYAQQSAQKGTVNVYYKPDKAYTLYLEVDNYLTEFVNLTDTLTFEPAYYEALIYNLAVRAFRYFHSDPAAQVPLDIREIANNSLNNIRTMNSEPVMAAMDLPGKTSKWNVWSDGTY